jgi:hypothetical protein
MDAHSTGMLLVVVGWASVVALMVVIYRRRRAARESAREERYRQLMAATLGAGPGLPRTGAADAAGPRAGAARGIRGEWQGGAASAVSPGPEARAGRHPREGAARTPGAEPRLEPRPSPGPGTVEDVRVPPSPAPHAPQPAVAGASSSDARAQALRMADALMAMRPGSPGAVPSSDTALPPPSPMRVRAPLLEAPARAMLLALRAAAPGHEVLVAPSLARLLDAPAGLSGLDRAMRLRQAAMLAVDFAVCTRTMELVATIDLQGQGSPAPEREARRAAAVLLEAAGVRHLVFDAAQLPRYAELRALIGLEAPGGTR